MTIRVLLADDQPLLREAFRLIIDSADDLEVVGEAADGREAVEMARSLRPHIVLMDIRMPGTDGLAATLEICGQDDLRDTRVLILTTFEIDEYVAQAIRAGASGFIGKGIAVDDLLTALRTVATGESLLSPVATRALITQFLSTPTTTLTSGSDMLDALTAREREVLALVATGLSNDEIADRMVVSPFTIRTHVQRAMGKLGARDRAQLVVAAYQSGLVQTGPPGPARRRLREDT